MKNKLVDLNNYLFEEIERLQDDETLEDEDNFKKEVERAKTITNIGKTIIDNARLALDGQKYMDMTEDNKSVPLMLQNKDEK